MLRALAVSALLAAGPGAVRAEAGPRDAFPDVARAYLVVVDGAERWARAPDQPLSPASLTKLMTALLALEAGEDPRTWIPVSRRAAAETGSRLGLRTGEAITAGDALTATLVASANDACRALAEHLGGSEAGFVERMNARARALGLAHTRYANACGHDAPGHATSARDLLTLTRAALAHSGFRRIVALERGEVRTRAGRVLPLRTHNELLGRLDGAWGVKSGWTSGAGQCLVAAADRGGVEVVVVLLDAPDRWWTAAALIEKAFEERAQP